MLSQRAAGVHGLLKKNTELQARVLIPQVTNKLLAKLLARLIAHVKDKFRK